MKYVFAVTWLAIAGLCATILAAAPRRNSDDQGSSTIAATHVPGIVAVKQSPMLRRWLDDGTLGDCEEIVFCLRVHGRDHWYANFAYYSAEMRVPRERCLKKEDGLLWAYGEGAALCKLNLRTGELTVLLHDERGGIRDPHIHYDAQKILFAYRPGGTHNYHLYEIKVDGTNLRRLTQGDDDDFEPIYLPDDSIMFVSSRSHRFVNCFYTRVTNLYRMDADGGNIRPLSSNVEHDNTPWLLPDGRVIYMRWEYVDRSQLHYHHLWTMMPDGSGQMVFYGNQEPGVVMLDAKPIPASRKVIVSFNPGHGRPEHMGRITIVDPTLGPDALQAARPIGKGFYRDPYPFSEGAYFVVGAPGLAVMDSQGRTEYFYRLKGSNGDLTCHEPRPIRSRRREPVIPARTDPQKPTGNMFLSNVYHGRNMDGVAPGEIKRLLVMEQLPKPVNFSGGMQPLTIFGTFTLARILGTVPVEPDGSAYFEAPAMRSLFFVALDEDDLSVKRMQSFATLMPGETTGCVGCHEQRQRPPVSRLDSQVLAGRKPRQIEPLADHPDVFDFPRDIQPILDRHCVECHNSDDRAGGVELVGDHTPRFSVSYWSIYRHRLVADGWNLPKSNYPPRGIGTSASPLMKYIEPDHYDVKLSKQEKDAIRWWIESSAVYPGTYAALGSGMIVPRVFHPQIVPRCAHCHGTKKYNTVLRKEVPAWRSGLPTDQEQLTTDFNCVLNISRPEKSLLLRAPLARDAGGLQLCGEPVFKDTNDPMYQKLLSQLRAARDRLQETKRFDMPGFRPNAEYVREMKRFGILAEDLGPQESIDPYKTDRRYWQSFWHRAGS